MAELRSKQMTELRSENYAYLLLIHHNASTKITEKVVRLSFCASNRRKVREAEVGNNDTLMKYKERNIARTRKF